MKILVVVDMQYDFTEGSLGSEEAVTILPLVKRKIQNFDGYILATRDTHDIHYLESFEGQRLPVAHCIKDTKGWQIHPEIAALITTNPIDKPTFGSIALAEVIKALDTKEKVDNITLVGVCTDICVVSNAMILKAYLPDVPVIVDASCCAGITHDSHKQALEVMRMCQIDIENE